MSPTSASEIHCRQLVELATDYLEGRLGAPARSRLELHLRSCAGCSAYLSQMRALVRAARRLPAEDLPLALREGLLTAFRDWRGR